MSEVIVKNFRRSRKFGWGYSFTPSGRSATSIETPSTPQYMGTLGKIQDSIEGDRTFQVHSHGGAFYTTAWFYDGRRITHTWSGCVTEAERGYTNEKGDYIVIRPDKYGEGWVSGFLSGYTDWDEEVDVRILVAD